MRKKILFSTIVIPIIAIYFLFSNFVINNKSISNGQITIIVIDEYENEIINDNVTFSEKQSLFEIINDNYNISCANHEYKKSTCTKDTILLLENHVILSINTVETDWYNNYLALYINDEYSLYGVDNTKINDGDVVKFIYTKIN